MHNIEDDTDSTESEDSAADSEVSEIALTENKENTYHTNDAYFMAHHKSTKTSQNTLAKVGVEVDPHEISTKASFPNDVVKRKFEYHCKQNVQQFPEMMYYLSHGFNLVWYGFGSKYDLLREFRKKYLADFPVLEITAFNTQQKLTGKGLLDNLLVELLGVAERVPRSTLDQGRIFDDYFSENRANPKGVQCVHLGQI